MKNLNKITTNIATAKGSDKHLRSSYFGLPIVPGSILGIFTVPTFVVLFLTERVETKGPPKDWKKSPQNAIK